MSEPAYFTCITVASLLVVHATSVCFTRSLPFATTARTDTARTAHYNSWFLHRVYTRDEGFPTPPKLKLHCAGVLRNITHMTGLAHPHGQFSVPRGRGSMGQMLSLIQEGEHYGTARPARRCAVSSNLHDMFEK